MTAKEYEVRFYGDERQLYPSISKDDYNGLRALSKEDVKKSKSEYLCGLTYSLLYAFLTSPQNQGILNFDSFWDNVDITNFQVSDEEFKKWLEEKGVSFEPSQIYHPLTGKLVYVTHFVEHDADISIFADTLPLMFLKVTYYRYTHNLRLDTQAWTHYINRWVICQKFSSYDELKEAGDAFLKEVYGEGTEVVDDEHDVSLNGQNDDSKTELA